MFDVVYQPRYAIKGQILANFIVELSDVSKDGSPCQLWILETNSSSKKAEEGVGVVL